MRLLLPSSVVAVGFAALTVLSCRSSTEITLRIRTNLPCTVAADWHGVAVYVGKPGPELEDAAPTLVTSTCEETGNVGSLVIVPSGAKDEEIGLRVVAGVERSPEECEAEKYQGCVVARRELRFLPHRSVELEVELTRDCKDVGCDPFSTCYNGACVDAAAVPAEPAPVIQGEAGPGFVRCGDDGQVCPARDDSVCCLSVDGNRTHGTCRVGSNCPSANIALHCDDDSDCPTQAEGYQLVCVLSYEAAPTDALVPTKISGSACLTATQAVQGGNDGLVLCEERATCNHGAAKCEDPNSDVLPGYHWCKVRF